MDTKDFARLLKKRKTTVISITLIFVIIGLIITLAQPLKYRSKSRLLILQSNTSSDAYTVSRSNEYVGSLISEVIYSGSFLDSLKNSNYIFDRNYFNDNYKENVKKWGKTVFARSSGSTGVIDIEIYHTNPEEAKRISNAVNQLIISGQSPYKFNADQTKISIIDEPVVSSFPVKPNIPVNLAMSILFGFLAGCSYIYLFPRERVSEKLAKEIFGNDLKVNYQPKQTVEAPIYRQIPETPAAPAYEPAYEPAQAPVYTPTVPENLPFYSLEETPEINEPDFKEPFHFQGNINNVLGE
jgi:capsular polysaccharide biosynthesis protein